MVNKREKIKMYKASKSLTTLLKMNEDIQKGGSMKIRVITINDKDYLLIDKKDIVDDKELRHILLSMKKCFNFLEENKDLYKCLNNVEYSENVRLDCIKSLLNDKYKDEVVLIKEEDIERIETGISI